MPPPPVVAEAVEPASAEAPAPVMQPQISNAGGGMAAGADVKPRGRKNRFVAGLLALIVGIFGIHKFYLGYTIAGLAYLALWLLCAVMMPDQQEPDAPATAWQVVAALFWLLCVVEGIIYMTTSGSEFDRKYVQGRRPVL